MKVDELKKWLRNKSVKRWKRILLLMYDEGEPMSFDEIAEIIDADRANVYRLMKKLEIDGWVTYEKEKHNWILTHRGEETLFSLQKKGEIPTRE